MRHGEQANAARLGLVVVTAFLLFSVQLTSAHASPPTARVVTVDYPERVFPGMRFNATIVVEYSDRFLADVGIWDARAGTIVQSLTLISSFTGPGQAKFSLQLTAPKNETDWHLIAMTRVWWQDAWYEDPDGGMKLFTVKVSDNIVLTVNSTGADSTVRFDGSTYIVNEGSPVAIVLKPGPHTLNVTPIIQARTGERFVFVGWSDGVRSSSRQIVLVSDAQILATYRTEYYLTVQSDAAAVSGQGWYVQGFEAPVAAVPDYSTTSWFGLLVHRYQFSQWSGDSSSGSPVARILMDGPKVVKAQWKLAQTTPGRDLLPYGFLAASLPLAIRILYVYSKRRSSPLSSMHTPIRRWGRISFLMMIVLFASFPVAPAEAQLPAQPGASIMKIGDADWYYWSQPASDTCLLWLGGGISQQTVIGYNYYWINPFDYESFGTIRFVQDLAKYYCVIALQSGSYESYNPAANRTIHQELYQIQSTIIMQVHQWIKQQGYQHTFLVGYSVGGQAAAMEVTLRAPNSWLSPDGVILITVPLERSLICLLYTSDAADE